MAAKNPPPVAQEQEALPNERNSARRVLPMLVRRTGPNCAFLLRKGATEGIVSNSEPPGGCA
jgi:hypothetical protein